MMEIRTPVWTADGRIDCEIDLPGLGWVPFTASAEDVEAAGREIFAIAAALGPTPYVAPPSAAPAGPKWAGIEFEGVMCSATAEDQAGLAAVLVAIQLQGAAFQPTRFYFANGNTLVLSLSNYAAFAAVWLPFRQSFFSVD